MEGVIISILSLLQLVLISLIFAVNQKAALTKEIIEILEEIGTKKKEIQEHEKDLNECIKTSEKLRKVLIIIFSFNFFLFCFFLIKL